LPEPALAKSSSLWISSFENGGTPTDRTDFSRDYDWAASRCAFQAADFEFVLSEQETHVWQENLSHLYLNWPSDQLSWRTTCRTLHNETWSLRRLSAAALAAEAAYLLARFQATQGKMRLGKRERISRRARPTANPARQTPMPTPSSSLPQRSRVTLLSRRSSSPNRRSPLHIRHSPQYLLSPFRMNTCKSVSKQRTLTIFRMNTYAKTGGGGTLGYPRALYQSGSATIDLLLLCFHTLMSCFFCKYFVLITICVAPCADPTKDRHPDRAQRRGTGFPRRAFATFRNPCYLPHHQGDFKCQ